MHESQLIKKLESMQVSEKLPFLESTLESHPEYYKLRCILTHLLLDQKKIPAAEIQLKALTNMQPHAFATYNLTGKIAELKKDESKAYTAYKKAMELNHHSMALFKAYFDLLFRNKQYNEAALLLDQVETQWTNNPNFLSRKAKVLSINEETDSAIGLLEKAINSVANPTFVANLVLQLVELLRAEDSLSKLAYLKKYVQAYPQNIKLRLKHADVLAKEARLDEADAQLDSLLRLYPNHQVALLRKANLLVKTDKPKEAYTCYSRVNELNPSNPWAYVGMEKLIFQEGDIDAALELLSVGITKVKEPTILVYRKADLYIRTGSYNLALDLLNEYKQATGFIPQIHFLLAKIHQRKGEFDQAQQELELISSELSNDKEWKNKVIGLKAHIAFLEYDYKKATRFFENLVLTSEKTSYSRNRLALLYLLQGKIDEGARELMIATREIEKSNETGKINIPLIGHSSRIINEFNIHPKLKSEVQKSFVLNEKERLVFLAKLQLDNPSYFGTALYLINELRVQGLFSEKTHQKSKEPKNEIPKIIVQYWNEAEPPAAIKNTMKTWSDKNQGYAHKIFSRQTARNFIKYHHGYSEAQAFMSCTHPAMQADFFRLAYLSKMGGFYADADDRAAKSLEPLRTAKSELVLKLGDFGCISNNFLGAAPGNEIINYTFEKGIENVVSYFNEGPWFKLGPGHLTTCISYCLSRFIVHNQLDKFPSLIVLDQAASRNYLYQHLSLPYKSSDKSWYAAEYKRKISKK